MGLSERSGVNALVSAKRQNIWLAIACIALAVGTSLWLGQDANWDLRNYHFYNPYAWWQDRMGIDVAPAQLQTFHSPFADLPFYFMVRAGLSSWLIGAVLALPAVLALFFLAKIAELVLPESARGYGTIAVLLTAATGACGRPVIGSTMSEWHVTALFTAAVWLALKNGAARSQAAQSDGRRVWIVCGLLGGMAVGFKLTGGTFALALLALIAVMPADWVERGRRLGLTGLGMAAGFVFIYGPWAWELWIRYQNPFFPYFNDIFRSPWVAPIRYADTHLATNTLVDLLALPFRLMKEASPRFTDLPMRDWRIALAFPALIWLACKPGAGIHRFAWRGLLAFYAVSYLVWAQASGIYRYIGTLELIASLGIIAFVASVVRRGTVVVLFIAVCLIVGTTRWPDWRRAPHGRPIVFASVPTLPENSMVVIASLEPMAYVVPSLPPAVPVISLINNFLRTGPDRSKLQELATRRVDSHGGPLWLLMNRRWAEEKYYDGRYLADMLGSLGFAPDRTECKGLQTGWGEDGLMLCRLTRIPKRAEGVR